MLTKWHDSVREDIKRLESWQDRTGGRIVPRFRGRVVRLDIELGEKKVFLEAIYRPSKVTRRSMDYWLTYAVIQAGSVDTVTDTMARGLRFLDKHPEEILGLMEISTSTRNNKFWNHLARRMLECL